YTEKQVMRVAIANNVDKIFMTHDGLLSTPACSMAVRNYKTTVGILLTASHNEGGLNADFGIKIENETGGLLSETVNQKFIEKLKTIKDYEIFEGTDYDVSTHKSVMFFDAVKLYADTMESLFDFSVLKKRFKKQRIIIDALSGTAGVYLREVFKNRLGLENFEIRNEISLPDFKAGHPEPNPLYAKDLYTELLENSEVIGCAFDADVDRYMIVSEGQFLAPPDLLALFAKYIPLAEGYKDGLNGVSRSMPTARILDYVAKDLGLDLYEVPTAWRYFTNLMDAGKVTLCGEESFGTGSNHIREKDGIWGFLVWLNTLAQTQKTTHEIISDLWGKYGRFYTCRYDYETTQENAQAVFKHLEILVPYTVSGYEIESISEFNFTDPVTQEYIPHQGWIVLFKDGSRVITRLSNTGTKGALLRVYLEKREMKDFKKDAQKFTEDLGKVAVEVLGLEKYLKTSRPDVIVKG
ncbi:MAG: alpha-D-glucose phosphate-specific phosphoglucomutase, partial [Alphaproteobacteria bacterium]